MFAFLMHSEMCSFHFKSELIVTPKIFTLFDTDSSLPFITIGGKLWVFLLKSRGCILPIMHCRCKHCWELFHPFSHHCNTDATTVFVLLAQQCWELLRPFARSSTYHKNVFWWLCFYLTLQSRLNMYAGSSTHHS